MVLDILKYIGIAILVVLYFLDWWEYYQDIVENDCPTDKCGYISCVIVALLRITNHWAVPAIAIWCVNNKL